MADWQFAYGCMEPIIIGAHPDFQKT